MDPDKQKPIAARFWVYTYYTDFDIFPLVTWKSYLAIYKVGFFHI
jgi:hypothetical protein